MIGTDKARAFSYSIHPTYLLHRHRNRETRNSQQQLRKASKHSIYPRVSHTPQTSLLKSYIPFPYAMMHVLSGLAATAHVLSRRGPHHHHLN